MESTKQEYYHFLNKVGPVAPEELKEGDLVTIFSKWLNHNSEWFEKSFNVTVEKVNIIDLDPERKHWNYRVCKYQITFKSHNGKRFELQPDRRGFHHDNVINKGLLTSFVIRQRNGSNSKKI